MSDVAGTATDPVCGMTVTFYSVCRQRSILFKEVMLCRGPVFMRIRQAKMDMSTHSIHSIIRRANATAVGPVALESQVACEAVAACWRQTQLRQVISFRP